MKVVIIEDEKPAARRLSRMLNELNINPIAQLHSVEESINWFLKNKQPDLLFLDIQLSDGLSFEIFDEIEVKSAIIFTTAYDEYALKAFKLNSVDYLLKPIDADELKNAIDKYQEIHTSKNLNTITNQQLKELIFPNVNSYKKRFTVKIGQHLKLISTATIECFYSENKATYCCTTNNRNYMIDDTLEELQSKLSPELFFRVSRKYFVNINAIKDIISYTNSRLKIILNNYNETEIIVSRERVKDFKNWLS
ncbi:LytTR family DNA-binding domain-containing protein [Lutibacter sp.]|uniref:LytR/AlgR family response regulator transcription factor n=1 Tax=Lutibacter sp. TaxID=1925666 RepID=UPI0025BED352|nr:LytTR family DNA-binding domain-containing protein [Lutibacter sp.]MCF6181642.1 LytTR family DNA-binding domain-containing protein [Lutibacter sp.]